MSPRPTARGARSRSLEELFRALWTANLVSNLGGWMRQHHRVSVSDRGLEEEVRGFQIEGFPVSVHHYLAEAANRLA